MAGKKTGSIKARVHASLRRDITSGELSAGDQLPPMRRLAERFDTSICTIHNAVELLEEEGYLERRHGVGTFVADTTPDFSLLNTVALCMRFHAHLFGPLASELTSHLLQHHSTPMIVDMADEDSRRMMRSMARANVRFFIVHGNIHFPFDLLENSFFDDKWIVSVLRWYGPERPNLLRVLSDMEAGGRKAARHLWERGHRRAVVVGTGNCFYGIRQQRSPDGNRVPLGQAAGFVDEWEKLGGTWETLRSRVNKEGEDVFVWLDKEEFTDVFDRGSEPPTAVFGFRDVEGARVQQGLRRWCPGLAEDVDIVGYFDTPWSRAMDPPLSTISLRLNRVAERVAELVEAVLEGRDIDNPTRIVEPKLIVR